MTHPAIDLISTSYGFPGSVPVPGHIANSFTGVFTMGKLHFGAADNTPALSPGWWCRRRWRNSESAVRQHE